MQAQSRPSLSELTTRSRGQVIDTVWASATKVALMRRHDQQDKLISLFFSLLLFCVFFLISDSELYTDSSSDDGRWEPAANRPQQQVKRGLDMDGSQVALSYQRRRAAGALGNSAAGFFGRLPRVSATVQLALTDHGLGRGLARKIAAAEAAFIGKMRKKKEKVR